MPRFFSSAPLTAGTTTQLPAGAARHVQVLRLQPGDPLTLFDGSGGEFAATVAQMGRSEVSVHVGTHRAAECEAPRAVNLAIGMPANERMDWLVEKAVELGVASIQPLVTAHGVLRLAAERAEKKQAHWQAIAVAACEQCGRNRVPRVWPVQTFARWIDALPGPVAVDQAAGKPAARRIVLSLAEGTRPLPVVGASGEAADDVWVLSGPEGGLSSDEERQALQRGFAPVSLGPRVLRAETAALAALVQLASA